MNYALCHLFEPFGDNSNFVFFYHFTFDGHSLSILSLMREGTNRSSFIWPYEVDSKLHADEL
jgi:hypothetical protein